MKSRKKQSVEQGVPGYGPQVAAMHTPPHAANLFRYGRGPIQNPDVSGNEENMGMLAELQGVSSNAKGKSNENTNKRWRHKNILTHHHVTMPMRSRTGQGCGSFRRVYGRDCIYGAL